MIPIECQWKPIEFLMPDTAGASRLHGSPPNLFLMKDSLL